MLTNHAHEAQGSAVCGIDNNKKKTYATTINFCDSAYLQGGGLSGNVRLLHFSAIQKTLLNNHASRNP